MENAVEVASYGIIVYIPGFTKMRIGVQTVLRFCLRNLRTCNVGITDGVRCHVIHAKFHKGWFRNSRLIAEHTQEGDLISVLLFFSQ